MKAYIFDLDGTLFDSSGLWEQIDIDFLKKREIAVPPDYIDTVCAMSFREAAVYTIERFTLNESVEDLMREWNDMAVYAYGHTVALKPYAKELLSALRERGAKLAVATGLSSELYAPALKSHNIFELFDVICGSEEEGRGKSHPGIFLLAAKKLGVHPRDCIVFEDILAAVKSAKSAGMTVYGIYDEASKNDWEQIKETADYAAFGFNEVVLLC